MSQVRKPDTAASRHWNRWLRGHLPGLLREAYRGATSSGGPEPARETHAAVRLQVYGAAPGVILTEFSTYMYANDWMQSGEQVRWSIWSTWESRPLTAEEIFEPASRWWTRLVPQVYRAAYEEPIDNSIPHYEALERRQTPRVSRNGLWLKFRESDSSSFVLDQPIFLSWSSVRPFLRESLPFDPAALQLAEDCPRLCQDTPGWKASAPAGRAQSVSR